MLVCQCNLDGVQVFTLDVLHECHLHHLLVFRRTDIGGDGGEACQCGRSPTTLTGNDLIFIFSHLPEGDGRDESDLTDAGSQFLQRRFIEVCSWLVRIGRDHRQGDLTQVGRTLDVDITRVNQGVESATLP